VQQAHHWWVLRDPAGLLFCVLPAQPGSLTDANAHRWDLRSRVADALAPSRPRRRRRQGRRRSTA
jgi:hypothetical protein